MPPTQKLPSQSSKEPQLAPTQEQAAPSAEGVVPADYVPAVADDTTPMLDAAAVEMGGESLAPIDNAVGPEAAGPEAGAEAEGGVLEAGAELGAGGVGLIAPEGGGGDGPPGGGGDGEKAGPGSLGPLTALAAAINDGSAARLGVPELVDVLKGPFESNWFKAKDCLLMDNWPGGLVVDHAKAIAFMKLLVAMRAVKCAEVQAFVEENIQAQLTETATKPQALDDPLDDKAVMGALASEAEKPNTAPEEGKKKPHVNFEAPKGNDKPSSDVDIAMKGGNTEIGVAMFNTQFKKHLGVPYEAATVFDYNVYAQDWIHNLDFKKADPSNGKSAVVAITTGVEHDPRAKEDTEQRAADKEQRDLTLEKASLLHIRRFMSETEWDAYSAQRLDRVSDADEKFALAKLLLKVDAQFVQFEDLVAAKTAEVSGALDAAVGGHESAWEKHAAHHFDDGAKRSTASNRIYEEKLRELKAIRTRYKLADVKPITEEARRNLAALAQDATRVLSEALYFANEVYATEGAVLHTVVAIQIADKTATEQGGQKPEVNLSPEQYEQSFNENVGDVLKDLDHFKDNPPFALFRAGKYMDRMLKAAVLLTPAAMKHEHYPDFASMSSKAVEVKGDSIKGEDPLLCAEAFDDDVGPDTLTALRAKVLTFGADIPTLKEREAAKLAAPKPEAPKSEDTKPEAPVEASKPSPELALAESASKPLVDAAPALDKVGDAAPKGT